VGAVDVLPASAPAIEHEPLRVARRKDGRPVTFALASEACAALAWAVAAEALHGDALRVGVAVVGISLVLARVIAGGMRGGRAGSLAWLMIAACRVAIVAPAVLAGRDVRLSALLAAASAVPLCAAALPARVFRGVGWARREDLPGALLLAALFAGAGVLVAIALAPGTLEGDLPALAPYAAAAAGVLGVVEVLAQHRAGAGFADSVAIIGTVAVAVACAVGLAGADSPGDAGTSASLAAAAVLGLGLLTATALSSPRPVVLDADLAGDGPRLAAPALVALTAAGVVLRLLSIRPLWIDEATSTRQFHLHSPFAVLDAAGRSGSHPPLYDVFAWAAAKLPELGQVTLRLPSLIAGVLLIPMVYVTATELYDRRAGLIAATIATVAPAAVWFSGMAEPAATASLWALVALWAMIRAIRTRRGVHWLLFAASGSALVWTHQLGWLHVLVLHVGVAAVALRCVRRKEATARLLAGWLASLAATGAAFATLVAEHGLGSRYLVPPFEYATNGAPGGGRSVFGVVNSATSSVLGFHPPDITSRLLALWPLMILAAFLVVGRRWSLRGGLLVALALTPFAFLFIAQIAGRPREPAYAAEWVATAVPMLVIGVGRAASLAGRWPRVRTLGLVIAAVLCLAVVDQRVRVQPFERFDIASVMDVLDEQTRPGDAVVYAPGSLGDLVRYEARGATVVSLSHAGSVQNAKRIEVVAAFALGDETTSRQTLALIKQLSSSRHLASRHGTDDVRMWVFE
jgi:4-amino-4-deoxy-L-arabinose transferase-like glycosyltransferase